MRQVGEGRHFSFALVALAILALVVAGCAGQSGAANSSAATVATAAPVAVATAAPAAATEMAPTTAAAPAAMTAAIMLGKNDKLGDIVMDEKGMTLYLFTKDTKNVSNCYDSCATKWPPLLTSGKPVAGAGVDASLLGVTTRKDGSTQVTYNGWPLYYWFQDQKPGDATGQDVGGVWYVVNAKGEEVETPGGG